MRCGTGKMLPHLCAISIMARSAGITGMIAGQVQDVALEGQKISQEQLAYIHAHKTGDMITGALLSGLELCHPSAATAGCAALL